MGFSCCETPHAQCIYNTFVPGIRQVLQHFWRKNILARCMCAGSIQYEFVMSQGKTRIRARKQGCIWSSRSTITNSAFSPSQKPPTCFTFLPWHTKECGANLIGRWQKTYSHFSLLTALSLNKTSVPILLPNPTQQKKINQVSGTGTPQRLSRGPGISSITWTQLSGNLYRSSLPRRILGMGGGEKGGRREEKKR